MEVKIEVGAEVEVEVVAGASGIEGVGERALEGIKGRIGRTWFAFCC